MLANCVQHVLSKPLLQISEAAYYLTSLPEDAPLAKVNPILEMVKDASNAHLEEMSLLQAGLSIPDSLPDTARPMQVDEAFLQMIAGNMPQLRTEVFVEDTANAPTILTQPDWVMRGFTELMRSHTAVQAVGMSTVPCITAKRDEGMVHITLADGGDLLQVNAGYTPLEKIMGSASMCESLAPRMLALLYLHAVAHAHGGTVAAKSDSAYRLAVRLSIPEVTPH